MSLVNNWKWLHKQVDLNGELIEERWNKKTRLKRFLALKTAMGDYVLPRDLTLWRDNPFPAPDEEPARYRKALLLNYLTMNRLTIEPERFLGLLHSRAYFDPMAFAVCDNQRLEWVWKSGLLKTDYSKLMFNINRPSPQYCKLVDWQKDSCKWRLAIGFPRATLLLEAQQTILAFLKNTVNDLLNAGLPDIDHREPFIRSVGGFKYNSQEEHWCPYLNQPFTEPRVAREPEMADIARARHLVVADHLYILQTDSNYLLRMIFQISAALGHERERDDILRQTVAEISYDIWNYWSWELISRACRAVLHQQIKFGTRKSNKSKAVWVLRYQAAIHELSVLLNEQLEDRASYIPL
jgi:hypothetical protein